MRLSAFVDPRDPRSPFAICHYADDPREWIPGELVTSAMMNTEIRDRFLEIEAGGAQMVKVTLVGDTTSNLAAIESDPYEAALAYDITTGEIKASLDGGPFAALSGGDASTIVFSPANNNPPSSSFAVPNVRNSHPTLDFTTGSDLSAIFSGVFWPDYAGENVEVDVIWAAATATSGTVRIDASFERVGVALDIDADSFASVNSATTAAASGTSGIATKTTIAFTSAEIDGLIAGEKFRLKITRDDDHAGDTMTGVWQVLAVVLRKV